MRRLAFGLTLALSVGLLSTVVRGAPPTGSVTPGPNRTLTVCVNDPDDPPGTPELVELGIDFNLYDRFTVADSSCVTRSYAPFGPANHTASVRATDAQGQSSFLWYEVPFSETCDAFSNPFARGFCLDPAGQGYYATRQSKTHPLMSDHVWAGLTTDYGGAIMQLYSSDRSFNLLTEHPGSGLQLSLWGAATTAGPPPPPVGIGNEANRCNGWVPGPGEETKMNTIQTQGPDCAWGHTANEHGYWGPTVGAGVYTHTAENHLRKWPMPNFPTWTTAYIRPDYLELTYRFINGTQWGWSSAGQEIPAIHLNQGMNYSYSGAQAAGPGTKFGRLEQSSSIFSSRPASHRLRSIPRVTGRGAGLLPATPVFGASRSRRTIHPARGASTCHT